MKKSKSGFTIVELLVVIATIAIIASIVFVVYGSLQARARDDKRATDIANLQKALEIYYSDNGKYPTASGTSSVLNPSWYTSGDSSWTTFSSALTGSNAMDDVPTDPINSPGNPFTATNYSYAYFSGSYCGKTGGQMYLILFRYEKTSKTKSSVGDCTSNELGDNYYNSYGSSYVRVMR